MARGSTRITKNKLFELLFFVAYSAIFAYSIFGHIEYLGIMLRNISTIGYILLIILIILQIKCFTPKDVMHSILFLILAIVVALNTNNYSFLKMLLIIASARTLNVRQFIKVDLVIRFIFLLTMIALFTANIAPDNQSFVDGAIRHSLGFNNCNQFGMYIFIMIAEMIYLNNAKLNFKIIPAIAILLLLEETTSGSRTVFAATLLLAAIIILNKINQKILNHKIIRTLIIMLPVILLLITLIATQLYAEGVAWMQQLDIILSGRLRIIDKFLDIYEIRLLGNDISATKITLDNLYAYSVISLGIIPTLAIIISYIGLQKRLYIKNERLLIIILTTFMIYGLSERLWLYPEYNAIVLIIKEFIYEKTTSNE